ncbi:MAG: DUF1566 domain-containing protein [Proteobacteria bacterium]|nr:DUF1566 domain-containing protein [Pseudomonadota bacterium]MBU1709892.1 DUF1566 domain-containing protein [Pseudomonadota bacterium]
MGIFEKLGLEKNISIDWEITPELTFTIFESWGSRVRVRSLAERYYYFYIDTWQDPAKVCLMERGIKYARVLAEIDVPQGLIDNCVAGHGKTQGLDKSYAVDDALKKWLISNVIDTDDATKVKPVVSGLEVEDMASGLPGPGSPIPEIEKVFLQSTHSEIDDQAMSGIVLRHNFFDSKYNPQGFFENFLVDNGDNRTVTDHRTGIMWQRRGADIATIRSMQKTLGECNRKSFAGFNDWRLPTVEEALSLLNPDLNEKDLHIHACFSTAQPFIFLDAQRLPGGYWFADFKQGTVYWASGFNPGGFGRFCRNI